MTPAARIVDNGIGAYEFCGHRGTHVQLGVELDEVLKVDVTDDDEIENTIHGTVRGGCDGEHAGRCNRSCIEFEVDYVGKLDRVAVEKGRKIAYYMIEQA